MIKIEFEYLVTIGKHIKIGVIIMANFPSNIKREAVFDATRTYRYWLRREWDARLPGLTFVLLNPSIADEVNDDNAVRCCMRFACDWNFGSVEIVNLFGIVDTHPKKMKGFQNPVGSCNDQYVMESVNRASAVVIGWGNDGRHAGRAKEMLELLKEHSLLCLGKTTEGQPRYPSRLPTDTPRVKF